MAKTRKAGAGHNSSQLSITQEGHAMRFVIGPDTALKLAAQRARPPARHKLLAPTLLRSQVLAQLYADVRSGRIDKRNAKAQLDHLRALQIRLLGDRVLQSTAWAIAEQLGWGDTFVAEYVALTKLQADALVVEDAELARVVSRLVPVARLDDLLG
jgi:predicted nucleic acid-binding protein